MAAAAAPAAAPTIVNAVASSFVVWPRSELLGVGDDPVPHWAKVLLTAAAQGTFKYPAGHARAGQLDESSTGVFKSWLMTTVESDLMADTMSLTGPGNNEEEKLNGAEFRVPDDLPPHWVTFENATALQCRNHLSRKCAEAVTVSSMVQDMKGDDFDPEKEELGAWFDALARKRGKVKSAVSLREFFDMVESLLPGEEGLHEDIEGMRHPPESLSGAVSKFPDSDRKSIAVFKRRLTDHEEVLRKCALKLKIKKGRWWKEEDDSKSGKSKKKKSEGVNALEESSEARQVRQLTELLAQMQVTQQQQSEKICALTGQQETGKKEGEELSWEAKAKAQADEIAQLRAQAAGSAAGGAAGGAGGTRMGAGHGGGYGQGGGGYGQGGGYQPMGQTPGSPDYTGCNRCGSLEHKGADCPRNPRNRQQGGYQQGGYQRGSRGPGVRTRWRRRVPAIPRAAESAWDYGQGAAAGTGHQARSEAEWASAWPSFRGQ